MSADELPAPDLASMLTILGDAVTGEVVRALEGTGLRHCHGYLVQRLLVAPATATEMAAELHVSQQAVSRSVKELVALGHVEMTTDPHDMRRRPVRLTRRGRAAVERARRTGKDVDDRIRARLGEERFRALIEDVTETLEALGVLDDVRRRTVAPPTRDLR